MADQYRIVEAQLSLIGGLGGHNLLAIVDANGNVVRELNGIATTPDGTELPIGFIPFYHRLQVREYLDAHFYSSDLSQATLFTGSLSDVLTRWNAALNARDLINAKDLFYPPGGFGDNSNSVASTLIRVMGLTEPQLPGVPFYRFVPGTGTSLLDDVAIINIQQTFGILPSTPGSSRAVDFQSAVNNPDGSVTIFTNYKDGTSAISHYRNGGFEETLYGIDGGAIGSVIASSSNSGKVSVNLSGQVGEVNWDNADITVLPGAQATITGTGNNILGQANSTLNLTVYDSTIATLAGTNLVVAGTNNRMVLGPNGVYQNNASLSTIITSTGGQLINSGHNNNLILGTGTTVDMLGNNNTVIGAVPPGSISDGGTGNQSLSGLNLPMDVLVDIFTSTGFHATIGLDGLVDLLAAGSVGGFIDGDPIPPDPDPIGGGGGGGLGPDPLINGHSFVFAGDLTLVAGDADNSLQTGVGVNRIVAGDGNNSIFADQGTANTIAVGNGNNTVTATAGDSVVSLGDGRNQVLLGNGNDIVTAGNGFNTITLGGVGNKTITAGPSGALRLLDQFLVQPGQLPLLANNVMVGGSRNDHLEGGWANATLFGNAGNDTLIGGRGGGSSFLDGGAGDDSLLGNTGNDSLFGDDGNDSLLGSYGSDTLIGGSGDDNLVGDVGAGVITGISGNDFLDGGDGNDTLDGGAGDDRLLGGAGDDYLNGGEGIDFLEGGDGDDMLFNPSGNDTLLGGAGNDQLGGSGVLDGGAGDDLFQTDAGSHVVFGVGSGHDAITFAGQATIDLGAGITPTNVSVTRVNPGSALPFATGADLLLSLPETGDRLLIEGYFGDVANFGAPPLIHFANGTVWNSETVKDLVLTGNGDTQTLQGFADRNDTFRGSAARELQVGLAGNDTFVSSGGSDILLGGQGNDTYQVAAGLGNAIASEAGGSSDLLTFAAGITPSSVTVLRSRNDLVLYLNTTGEQITIVAFFADSRQQIETFRFADGTTWDALTVAGLAVTSTGTEGADVILGTSATDQLFGFGGNDLLNGAGGADQLIGGEGNDTYIIGSDDTVVEQANEGVDTVVTDQTYQLGANIENLTLTGVGNINGTGNVLDNVLTGNSGANVLTGGTGNDTYVIGVGDTVVEQVNEGVDTVVTDQTYQLGANLENLTLTGTAAIDGTGNDSDNTLMGNSAANVLTGGLGNDTYLFGRTSGSDTIVDVDGTVGNLDAVQLSDDVLPSDITVSRSGDDLVLGISGTPAQLTIQSFYLGPSNQVEQFRFSNGTAWDIAAITNRLPSPPNLTNPAYQIAQARFADTLRDRPRVLLQGGPGNDFLLGEVQPPGTNFDHLLTGDAGDDTLAGDSIFGLPGEGDDQLLGENGNDRLFAGGGNDVLDGGTGDDTLYGDGLFTLFEFANLQPSLLPGNDVLYGRDGNDYLDGGAGDDLLDGGIGNDALAGGNGEDFLFGGAGNDSLNGGAGNDQVLGEDGDDSLSGGSRNDVLNGGAGNDTLSGDEGDDTYIFGRWYGRDTIVDSHFNLSDFDIVQFTPDVLPGDVSVGRVLDSFVTLDLVLSISGTSDQLIVQNFFGDTANHIQQVQFSDGTVWDVATLRDKSRTLTGSDTSEFVAGAEYDLDETINGLAGDDFLFGLGGTDLLLGGDGNDTLDGGTGNDVMQGGAGDDTYFVDSPFDTVVELPGEGIDSVQSTVSYTLSDALENLSVNGQGLVGVGNALDNRLSSSGWSVLEGLAGNDTLSGGPSDVLIGGAGDDHYSLDLAGGVMAPTLIVDTALPGEGNDLFLGLSGPVSASALKLNVVAGRLELAESVLFSNFDPYNPYGPHAVETYDLQFSTYSYQQLIDLGFQITGTATDDLLLGTILADNLTGGAGNDELRGGPGNDTYHFSIGGGVDTITDQATSGAENLLRFGVVADDGTVQSSVTIGDVDFTQVGNVLEIAVGEKGDAVRLMNFDPQGLTGSLVVGQLMFTDGLQISLGALVTSLSTEVNDVFTGTAGNDLFYARGGDDVVQAGAGDDVILGGAGNDMLAGEDGNDQLVGGAGNDLLTGGAGNDQLSGGAGDDDLSGGVGNDVLSGGSGNDLYRLSVGDGQDVINDVAGVGQGNVLVLGAGFDSATTRFQIRYSDQSTLVLSNGADEVQLRGFNGEAPFGPHVVDSYQFADGTTLSYAQMLDRGIEFQGTENDDFIFAGRGSKDTLLGFGGNDTLVGVEGDDVLVGGPGTDFLQDYLGSDTYVFNVGDGLDYIYGEAFNPGDVNRLVLGPGITQADVTVIDNPFDITVTIGTNGDQVQIQKDFSIGGSPVQFIEFADGSQLSLNQPPPPIVGTAGNDLLTGTNQGELIQGLAGNDNIDAGAGDDILEGGPGNDDLRGEGGNDTYRFNLGDGIDTITDPDSLDAGNRILFGEGITRESLTATFASDVPFTISVGTAGDRIILAGFDPMPPVQNVVAPTLVFSDGSSMSVLDLLPSGTPTIAGDILLGTASADVINGLGGNDFINGGASNDILDGGAGRDTLVGGPGDDTYVVDFDFSEGLDIVIEMVGEGVDTVQSAASYLLGQNLENLTLIGTAAIDGTGNELANVLIGNVANNRLDGGSGADTLVGGQGDDTYVVDNVGDVVVEQLNEGTDSVQSSVSYALGANVENLTLDEPSNAVSAVGNGLNNVLIGNSLANFLDGGAGIDVLVGGTGDDTYVVDNVDDLVIEDPFFLQDIGDVGQFIILGGTDTVRSSVTYTLSENVENLTLTGTATIDGTGNELTNTLVGNNAANILTGGGDNDTLAGGGGGNDTLRGGIGNDIYLFNLGDGVDTIDDQAFPDEGNALVFGPGITPASVTLGLGSLVIRVGTAGDEVHLTNFNPNDVFGKHAVDAFRFADGTALTYQQLIDRGFDLTGTAGDDTITGTNAVDRILGLAGDDVIDAGAGNDVLIGGAGNDLLIGRAGNDTYDVDAPGDVVTELANEGTDTVQSSMSYTLGADLENLALTGTAPINGTGNAGNNTLIGNAVANTLDGGAGSDVLIGGGGDDTYIVDDPGDEVIELANEGTDTVQSSVSYTLSQNVENLVLTGTNPINGTGNGLDNTLTGNSAANVLTGGIGNDALNGGAGDDTYVFNLGDGVDTITDTVVPGAGNRIRFGAGIAQTDLTFAQNASTLTIQVGAGGDVLQLTNFNPANISGSLAVTTLEFADGSTANLADLLGPGIITGTDGDDVITGTSGNDVIDAKGGNDTVFAGEENDTILGGTGNDILDGGPGLDTMTGGQGDDTYVVDDSGDSVTELANEGTDTVQSSTTYALGSDVENLTLTGNAAINGTGNALDNVLTGNSGDNVLDGGTGADTLVGGAGHDTYVVDDVGDVVTESLNEGTDTVQSAITYTLGTNVEHLTLTGTAAVNGTGNMLNNVLTGNSAANVLDGGAGADLLIGGDGDDTFQTSVDGTWTSGFAARNSGSPGAAGTGQTVNLNGKNRSFDVFQGDAGTDRLLGTTGDDAIALDDLLSPFPTASGPRLAGIEVMDVGDGNDVVDLTSPTYAYGDVTLLGGNGDDVLWASSGNDVLQGGAGNDNLYGGVGSDQLTGGDGNDTLDGDGGSDTLVGGLGNDTYVVDDTDDVLTENANEGTDTVKSALTYTLATNFENLTLTGTTAIDGTGNSANNTLTGNSAANVLAGGLGNDTYVVGDGDTVVEQANEGIDSVQSNVSYTLAANVENLTLTGTTAINGTGNTLNNTLTGNSAANVLAGGLGDDTYVVGAGDTVIENLNEGIDRIQSSLTWTLAANVENLTLTGSTAVDGTGNALNNTLTGNSASNVLTGGDGDDTVNGGAGADTLLGGTGNDSYVVDNAGDIVTEQTNEGLDTVQSNLSWVLGTNVENLTLTGSAAINGTGNSLNNTLTGNTGANVLDSGTGDDTLNGGAGADTLLGGTGHDTYIVDNAGDVVTENLNEGLDTIQSSVTSTLSANVENLTLTGTAAINGTGNTLSNILTGTSGANVLDGGAGADTLVGGAGNDTYVVDDAGDVVTENLNEGTDTVQASISFTLGANVENLTLTGAAATNGTGNSANNILTGNAAANVLDGGGGTDTLRGGQGDDTYMIDDPTDVVTENLNEGTDIVQAGINYTLGANVENLTLTGPAALTGTGNTLNNVLTGNVAANVLNGGTGADTLSGGQSDDTYVVDNVGDVVTELANEGIDLVQSSVTSTLSANVENLTLTGSAAVNGTGNSLNNILTGNAGANVLDGGAGADTLVGGAGNDTYVVDDVGDVVTENLNQGTDMVQASIIYTLGANLEDLTLTGSAAINGTGNAGNNVLIGNGAANVLAGGDGNDTLDGGAGADTLIGGLGNDTYVVDEVNDLVTEALSEGTDTVKSNVTYTLSANVEHLTLTGTAAINGIGNALNNTLTGNSAANVLSGGLGNDTYVVSTGDTIVENANEGTDTVQSDIAWTLGSNFENLTLIGTAAISGTGNTLNNTLTGNSAANQLAGGLGNDTLRGGTGNDTYLFNRGDGQDTITENDATVGNSDSLLLGTTINPLDLVLSRQANDLRIAIHGTTEQVTIQSWYSAPTTAQIENLQTGNGQHLLNTQVDQLVQAMASFSQQSGLTWDQAIDQRPQDVQNVLAASWQ